LCAIPRKLYGNYSAPSVLAQLRRRDSLTLRLI
jgi:hypothetical protein